jgi:hypothetical protein
VATEVSLKEHADALVGAGQLRKAAALINAHLAENDAGWKLWNTLASLSRRLGRYELAVSAWRASARQLEAAGYVKHAQAALTSALRLTPADQALRDEVSRLSRLASSAAQSPSSRPTLRIVTSSTPARSPSAASRPTLKTAPPPRPAAPPGPARRSTQRPPVPKLTAPPMTSRPAPRPSGRSSASLCRQLEIVTDPHLAIFDIIDDEKQSR